MMPETPHRPFADSDRQGAEGPQLRHEFARAAAAVEVSELDVSDAIPAEEFELLAARGEDRGRPLSLVELAALAERGDDFPLPGPATLAALRRISERCRIRRELDLPREACATPEGTTCSCAQTALDELLDEGIRPTRRRVAQRARAHHCSAGKPYVQPPRPKPEPDPAPEADEEADEVEPDPPAPVPTAPPLPEREPSYVWKSQKSRERESGWKAFTDMRF